MLSVSHSCPVVCPLYSAFGRAVAARSRAGCAAGAGPVHGGIRPGETLPLALPTRVARAHRVYRSHWSMRWCSGCAAWLGCVWHWSSRVRRCCVRRSPARRVADHDGQVFPEVRLPPRLLPDRLGEVLPDELPHLVQRDAADRPGACGEEAGACCGCRFRTPVPLEPDTCLRVCAVVRADWLPHSKRTRSACRAACTKRCMRRQRCRGGVHGRDCAARL